MYKNSIQTISSEGAYVIRKEELKFLMTTFKLTEGNTDQIMN